MNGNSRQSRDLAGLPALLASVAAALLAPALLAPAPVLAGELRVVVEATAGFRDDGNYFQAEAAPPDLEDPETPVEEREVDAQVALAGLRTSLSYVLPRSALALVYAPTWERNLDRDDFDEVAHQLDLGYTSEASRLSRISLRERLLYSPSVDLSPSFLGDTVVVTRRGDQLRHAFNLDVGTQMTRRWSLQFGAGHTYREYEDPELFDTWSVGSTVGIQYSLDPRSAWGFGVGYQRYDFEGRSDDAASVYGSYRAEWGRDLHFAVTLGAFQVAETRQPDDDVIPLPQPGAAPQPQVAGEEIREERRGFQGGINVDGRRGELFSWNAGYDHGVSPGYSLGRAVESDRAYAGISVPFGRRVTFGLNGTGQRNNDLQEGEPEVNRLAAGNASVDWAFANWGRVSGTYSRVWQDSEVDTLSDLDYDRFTVGISLRLYATGEPPIAPGKEGEPRDDDPDVP